jgi:hypothetical protein
MPFFRGFWYYFYNSNVVLLFFFSPQQWTLSMQSPVARANSHHQLQEEGSTARDLMSVSGALFPAK